ncbi:hypothetical protein B566_EDAN011960 [Ephemera danica]|nr:hypothetical protein B566_EDAN011960 [Ephemera danica]
MPSGGSELHTEAGSSSKPNNDANPLEETTTPRVNGEVNGSSAGEEADSNPENSPTPPPCKRVRNGAAEEGTTQDKVLRQKAVSDSSSPSTKAAKSPIVVELSSDVDSPVKHINNSVKRKLDSVVEDCDISDSDIMDTGEHKNGEVSGECSDDASESVEQNKSPPAENGGDSEMEVEEIENGNKSTEVLNLSDGEDEIKEHVSVSGMEAVIMPSGGSELHTEAGSSSKPNNDANPLEETTTPRVNGEVNGSSAGEEADSNPENSPTPPPCKRVRNGAAEEGTTQDKVLRQKAVSDSSSPSTKAAKSPIVVELSSDVDSPVKHINNSVKRKLDSVVEDCDISDSDIMDTGEHKNGEVSGECSDDASESVEQNKSPPAENGGDSEMEVEEIENGNKSTEVLNLSDGEDEIKEVKSVTKKSKDSSGDTDIEEIHDDNDIEEVTTESKDPLDSDAKNGDEDDLKTPTSTPVGSPEKLKMQEARRKSAEAKKQALLNITPRRSSRNLNKNKKYIDGESEPEEPDIEEIVPVDPLAVSAADRVKMTEKDPLSATPEKEPTSAKAKRKNTIIVSDTKALAQIAANSKEGKKEPTLVIIDTNSILSGRGPIPVTSTPPSLPAALPAQGIYPIFNPQTQVVTPPPPKPQAPPAPKQKGPIGLTDDMYVVEAPSFIVPYVYEKPPKEPLKEVVEKMAKILREEEKKEREEKAKEKKRREKEREEREKEKKERAEKAKQKKEAEEKEVGKEGDDKEKKADGEEEAMEVDEEKKSKKDEDQQSDKEDDEEPKADHDSDYKADSAKDKDSEEEDLEYDSESDSSTSSKPSTKPKSTSYFDSPLGKFFMQIGVNLVQEHVQTDLLRMQKRKLQRGGTSNNPETQLAVHSLLKNLEQSKENNKPYKFEIKKCEFCNFKTESKIVLAHHLEMPHLKNFLYHCNFCPVALRTNHDILFHMEAEHNVNGRIERAPAFHQCPNCPFEDNQKSKMNRHMLSCVKRFRPEKNCEPPVEWEPPAKIPRMSKNMYRPILPGSPQTPQQYLNQRVQGLPQHPLLPKLPATSMMPTLISGSVRGRGRPSVTSRFLPDLKAMPRAIAPSQLRQVYINLCIYG